MGKRKRRHIYIGDKENEKLALEKDEEESKELPLLPGQTFNFHKDNRKTLVEVEGNLYSLVKSPITLQDLKKEKFKNIPHIRRLNPIHDRSEYQQELRNQEMKAIHKLAKQSSSNSKHITSLRKAMAEGADVPALIQKLLKEKEIAQKAGDEDKAKKIRRQLRGLDYKRYLKSDK